MRDTAPTGPRSKARARTCRRRAHVSVMQFPGPSVAWRPGREDRRGRRHHPAQRPHRHRGRCRPAPRRYRDAPDTPHPMGRSRRRGRVGPLELALGAHRCALPGRQLGARTDGALRVAASAGWAPTVDELVPLSRPRLAPVPPLPEPSVHADRSPGPGHRWRRRLPDHLVPVALPVAPVGVLVGAALRPGAQRVATGRRRRAVSHERGGRRVRAQGLPLDRVRSVGPVVGVVDTSTGVGLHLARHVIAPCGASRRRVRGPHRSHALRDRLPRPYRHRHLPLPHAQRASRPSAALPPAWHWERWPSRPG